MRLVIDPPPPEPEPEPEVRTKSVAGAFHEKAGQRGTAGGNSVVLGLTTEMSVRGKLERERRAARAAEARVEAVPMVMYTLPFIQRLERG